MDIHSFLVIDDQPESLAAIRRTLSDAHAAVQISSSTAEAFLALSDSRPFAGIIVRLQSRRIDGRSVVRSCRDTPHRAQVPVYVIVEDAELEQAAEVIAAGATEILLAPLEPRELRTKCRLTPSHREQKKQRRVDHSHTSQSQTEKPVPPQNIPVEAVDCFWSDSAELSENAAVGESEVVQRTPRSKLIIPEVDARSLRFSHGVSEQKLQDWQQDATVRKVSLDRAMLCPECGGLPTFRYGCGNCGSAFHEPETIIHHYACAYIGGESEFRRGTNLTCPKCLQKDLVAGSDFERVAGVFRCSDCNAIGNEPVLIGHCLCCHHRFLANEAFEYTLTGFHVPTSDLEHTSPKKHQRQFHTSHHASQKPPGSSKRRRRRSSSKRASE